MLDPVRDEEASEDRVDRVGMSSLPGVLLSSELGDEARELISLYWRGQDTDRVLVHAAKESDSGGNEGSDHQPARQVPGCALCLRRTIAVARVCGCNHSGYKQSEGSQRNRAVNCLHLSCGSRSYRSSHVKSRFG